MGQPCVYILRCANQRYYIGSTNDRRRRFAEHQAGNVAATRNIRPVEIVFFQVFDTLIEARSVEYKLKEKKSRAIIEQIIADGYIRFVRA